jgi:hypothetical protein
MTNVTGQIRLDGVTDREMARIWEMKARHGDAFAFNPQGIQVVYPQPQPPRPAYPPQPQPQYHQTLTYGNVVFTWNNPRGLEIVSEVIAYLLRKEEAEAVGQ